MRSLLIISLSLLLVAGCERKKLEAVSPPPAPPAASVKEPTIEELNEAVQAWFTSRGRPPESFEQMAQARFLPKVPTPPPGRQYVIDREKLRVVLQ